MIPQTYMQRPEEIEKHRRLIAINGGDDLGGSREVIAQMFGENNDDALRLALAFWEFENVLDDVMDELVKDDAKKNEILKAVEVWSSTLLVTAQKYAAKMPNIYEIGGVQPFEGQRGRLAEQAQREFGRQLWDNPFSNRYRFEIRALFVMALMRCIAGDVMKSNGNPLAVAVSCADVDIFVHLVFLARGWDAANRFSVIRQYDVPDGVLEGAT